MEATINEVFYQDQQARVELGETKRDAPILNWQRFPLFPRMSAEITQSKDPSDGDTHQLRVTMIVDGTAMSGVTDWIPNDSDTRTRVFSLDVDKHPAKLMQRGRVHSVSFRISKRKLAFGIPLPLTSKWEDIAESETYYYKIGANPNRE